MHHHTQEESEKKRSEEETFILSIRGWPTRCITTRKNSAIGALQAGEAKTAQSGQRNRSAVGRRVEER